MGDRKAPSLPPSERHSSDPVSRQVKPPPPPAPPPKCSSAGTVHDCQDCGKEFRSEDKWAVLCPKCDKADADAHGRAYGSIGRIYQYRRIGRGRYTD